jgi:hypothetical protein
MSGAVKDRALQLILEQVGNSPQEKFDAQVCRHATDEHMDEAAAFANRSMICAAMCFALHE